MYVPDSSLIDNSKLKLFSELQKILSEQKRLDIASGYFNLGGFQLIKDELKKSKKFRLLIGRTPERDDRKLIDDLFELKNAYEQAIKTDLEDEDLKKEKKESATDLIDFLKRKEVEVRLYDKTFLHGKAYIFDRLVITGSSNFTYSGLTANTELNAVLDEAHARYIREEWFEKFWKEAKDFKEELIQIYEESKFGTKEYRPYEVFIKALYELQKEDFLTKEGEISKDLPESVVDLSTFQEDAVKRIFSRLKLYNGVLVADSVGLGKTWIAKKIVEEFGFYRRRKFLVVCPAQLHNMWRDELKHLGVSENILHMENLGKEELDLEELESRHGIKLKEIALIVVDESHNFRNPISNRFEGLYSLIEHTHTDGNNPKIVLMTATPMNNTIWDLYHQLTLVSQNNKKIFIKDGIYDLEKEFKKAQQKGGEASRLNDVLQLISIRRTRQYIQENYPEAKFKAQDGQYEKITFPKRNLEAINYSLDEAYQGLYHEISKQIDQELTLAYYKLEDYKIDQKNREELQRMEALAGIYQTVLLKRLESSVEAFRKSIKGQIDFLNQFKKLLKEGKILRKKAYLKYLNFFEDEVEAEDILAEIKKDLEDIDLTDYNLKKLTADLDQDIKIFEEIYAKVKPITEKDDAKLKKFKEILLSLKKEPKIIIFSYYTDTIDYLYDALEKDKDTQRTLSKKIDKVDGSVPLNQRLETLNQFLNGDVDILFSTDILSEGQNLQKARVLINYDLHWNPTRMIQRAGRIDRIGTPFKEIAIYNFFPDQELELLLQLVRTLQNKIAMINDIVGLDSSVLGETISPKVFGVIRNLKEGSEKAKQEILRDLEAEQFGGGEIFWQPLKDHLKKYGLEPIEKIPHGIQSGLRKGSFRGVFFYYRYAEDFHFWYLYDSATKEFITNKSEILNFIACKENEPRVIPKDIDAYEINELVKQEIREMFYRSLIEAEVRTASGKKEKFIQDMMDELDHVNQEYLFEEDVVYREKAASAKKKLNEISFTKKRMQTLRRIWKGYKESKNWRKFLGKLSEFVSDKKVRGPEIKEEFDERKLKLICVDYIS